MKKPFTVQLSSEVIDALNTAADASHTSPTGLAAQALGILSEVEPKLMLSALGEIQARFGKRPGPGRPPSRPRASNGNLAQAA